MRIVTGFKGQAHITSGDQMAFNAGVVGTGLNIFTYVLPTGDGMEITKVSNTKVRVKCGDAIAQGIHFRIPYGETEDVTLSAGASGYYRRDRIVVHYTKTAGTGVESVELYVVEGTAAVSDADAHLPSLPSQAKVYEGATEAWSPFASVHFSGTTLDTVESDLNSIMTLASARNNIVELNTFKNLTWSRLNNIEDKTDRMDFGYTKRISRDAVATEASTTFDDVSSRNYMYAGNMVVDGHYFYPKVGGAWGGGTYSSLVEEMAAVINQIMYINSAVSIGDAPALTLYDNNTSKGGLTPEYQTTFRWKVMNLQIASYYFKFVSHGSNDALIGATISTVLALRGFDFKILGATGDITFAGSRTPLYLTPGGANQNYLFFRHGGTGASITGTVATDDYIRIVVFGII